MPDHQPEQNQPARRERGRGGVSRVSTERAEPRASRERSLPSTLTPKREGSLRRCGLESRRRPPSPPPKQLTFGFFSLSAGIVVRSIVLKLCRLALSAASTALRPSVSSMELDGVVRIV